VRQVDFREVSKDIVDVIRKSVAQEIKEGILYFIRKKEIRFISGIIFSLWAALGAVYVVLIVFVQNTLHSATKDLGFLVMFLGIGLFFGSLLYGRFGQRASHYKVIFVSLCLSGMMLLAFAWALHRFPSFSVAAFLSLSLGVVISPIMIASNTIVHQVSENGMMGKVFSSMEIVMHLGFLVFMFISSILAERFSQLIILVVVGVLVTLLGAVQLLRVRKIEELA
ncbi:MAG: MFS transporter, partial [Candidatus Omnitrophica bacterium]|nr:MFS transporter [Candidatus Omnitrophota bacterium]